MNPITYTDGGRGTATLEVGKLGPQAGPVLVLRRGYPVAAELAAGIPVALVSESLLSALHVSATDAEDLTERCASWAQRTTHTTTEG